MIRKSSFFVLFLAIFFTTAAQDGLVIEGSSPNLHLAHKVAAKETWYSLGRMYNLSPKEIASYNQLTIDKALEIGQLVNVPLTSANFAQNGVKKPEEVFIPLYHIVQEKEWMYRISLNHNKVPVESLEKWNSMTREQAKPGMKLIVGYLKVQQANAALASRSSVPPASAEPSKVSAPNKGPDAKSEIPKKEPDVAAVDPKKPEPPTSGTQPPERGTADRAANKGGYFKGLYDENGKNASGLSGVFKSSSGWSDGKYYALMNNVSVGTIVKINFPSTHKTIYAKVLGELPDMRESAGLALRISDAAANELGAVSSKFPVDVMY